MGFSAFQINTREQNVVQAGCLLGVATGDCRLLAQILFSRESECMTA